MVAGRIWVTRERFGGTDWQQALAAEPGGGTSGFLWSAGDSAKVFYARKWLPPSLSTLNSPSLPRFGRR